MPWARTTGYRVAQLDDADELPPANTTAGIVKKTAIMNNTILLYIMFPLFLLNAIHLVHISQQKKRLTGFF